MGLDEDLQDPTQPYYHEKKKLLGELKEISSLLQTGEGPDERPYNELRKRKSMQTKEVMGFFRCQHYQQSRRIMEKISESPDVIIEKNKHVKGYRIRMLKHIIFF